MRDSPANQFSARTPEAKSLSDYILDVTPCSSIFCWDRAYPKAGKRLRTKILESGIKKKYGPFWRSQIFTDTNLGLLCRWRRCDMLNRLKPGRCLPTSSDM